MKRDGTVIEKINLITYFWIRLLYCVEKIM